MKFPTPTITERRNETRRALRKIRKDETVAAGFDGNDGARLARHIPDCVYVVAGAFASLGSSSASSTRGAA